MEMNVKQFLDKTGLNENLQPGEVKFKKHIGEKESNSYTVVYDWKSDLNKIRVEVRPGLSGYMPLAKDLKKYALWLQTENYVEFEPETIH